MIQLVSKKTTNGEIIRLATKLAHQFGGESGDFTPDFRDVHQGALYVWKFYLEQFRWYMSIDPAYRGLKQVLVTL